MIGKGCEDWFQLQTGVRQADPISPYCRDGKLIYTWMVMGQQNFDVSEFEYLECCITYVGDCNNDIRRSIGKACSILACLNKLRNTDE